MIVVNENISMYFYFLLFSGKMLGFGMAYLSPCLV